ncbi:hypothetical protein [Paenibacillus oryzisoli]|uniref:Uncharacterized protein n=1 Tax=Paenibacillus oryzisoli TaxID=1850517 RepID=A0A198A2R8_9BACL|nr:hypothetical protein [Paenibacillus oryzisoli]OAS15402.1 hypothetical protein A8708_04420 [Paenibacillus oryzisoli]
MWTITSILIVTAAIGMIEVPSLLRKKRIKELSVFTVLLLFGAGLCLALTWHANIPNPLDWITFVYKPISVMLNNWLK